MILVNSEIKSKKEGYQKNEHNEIIHKRGGKQY